MAGPKYLIDANLCINLLDGASQAADVRLAACEVGEVVTSAVVYAEVMIGAEQQGKAERAMAFFAQVPVLSFDEAAGRAYACVPFERNQFHRLIAGHALSLGLTVITSEPEDYKDVPGLEVEDWVRE